MVARIAMMAAVGAQWLLHLPKCLLSRFHLARRIITAIGIRNCGDDYRPFFNSVGLTSIGGGYAAIVTPLAHLKTFY